MNHTNKQKKQAKILSEQAILDGIREGCGSFTPDIVRSMTSRSFYAYVKISDNYRFAVARFSDHASGKNNKPWFDFTKEHTYDEVVRFVKGSIRRGLDGYFYASMRQVDDQAGDDEIAS